MRKLYGMFKKMLLECKQQFGIAEYLLLAGTISIIVWAGYVHEHYAPFLMNRNQQDAASLRTTFKRAELQYSEAQGKYLSDKCNANILTAECYQAKRDMVNADCDQSRIIARYAELANHNASFESDPGYKRLEPMKDLPYQTKPRFGSCDQ